MTVTKEMLEEAVLSYSQRKKKAQTLRKFAAKIQMARKRALKRLATGDSLEIRARRAAVKIVRRLVAGRMGLKYAELSIGQKIEIDKKVSKRTKLIDKISGRLLPKIRAKEVARFKSQHTPLKEKAGAGEDGTDELVQTYVEDTPHQGNPFLPGQDLDKQYFFDRYGHNAEEIMRLIYSKVEEPRAVVMKTSERARKTDDSGND